MGFFSDLASDAKGAPPAGTRPARAAGQPAVPPKAPAGSLAKSAQPVAPENTASADAAPAVSGKPSEDDAARRRAHEDAEANRRVEWEAAQAERRASEQAQLDRVAAMSPDDVAALSAKRVSADTERLTRRNMKDCVSEHIQSLCRENPTFARRVLHPRKTMARCFRYIYRQAREFAEREITNLGESHVDGVYGLDVPDGLCYQWAEAYFNDPDAPEDKEKDDKFVSRPYCGGGKAKKAPEKKPALKEYILDPQGKKIYDPKKRQYKCKAIPATDWNEQTKAEEWRAAWAQLCNRALWR